ncbi:MAG: hypothetical protein EBU70_11330, partial [Actinobacteria bacterium]|nr:hypothetical protein [Actinomycetota bacterium]
PGGIGEHAWAVISGIPDGVKLSVDGLAVAASAGAITLSTVTGPTTYAVAVTEFPADWNGSFVLTVTAYSKDGSAAAASASSQVTVSVDAVADLPALVAPAQVVVEDSLSSGGEQRIPLDLAAALADTDGSEALGIAIGGLPAGARLNLGSQSGGVWTVAPAELGRIQLILPQHMSGTFTLSVTATATERATLGGAESDLSDNAWSRVETQVVTVQAVADSPVLSVSPWSSGSEDNFIALAIGATLVDRDGSETLSYRLSGIPSGAALRSDATPGGIAAGLDGAYTIGPAELAGLAVRPPANSDADFVVGVTAIATESSNGASAASTASISVRVAAVADPASLSYRMSSTEAAIDGASGTVDLQLGVSLGDADGSEAATAVVVSGVPGGYRLTSGLITAINGDGTTTWTLRRLPDGIAEWEGAKLVGWPADKAGSLVLGATVVITDSDGSVGATPQALTLSVTPGIDAPAPHGGGRGNEDSWVRLSIVPGIADRDGSEQLAGNVTLSQVPASVQVMAGGAVLSATPVDGACTYVLTPAQLASLFVRGAEN